MRGFLQAIIPFLIPFALYFAWVWLARREQLADWRAAPWIALSFGGLVLAAGALLWFAESRALDDGTYQPARIEGGRIIDGGTRPPGP
ncbi:DUF6111 family protein [Elioraea rosea]|uniref:DUF6111 family protein n=1 Tax=Elioraea rosea TaxID=2492390 RepID=UPI001186EC46|nr:DUF6111 family protein [Elioraea rosea]